MIEIKVVGLKELMAAMDKAPARIKHILVEAGNEAGNDVILPTEGLKTYPPPTSGNAPPTPYYIRGRGTETARGNLYNSERLGTQFYVKSQPLKTYIGNRASYAPAVIGEFQDSLFKFIGWRRLIDVAHEKMSEIVKVYQNAIDYALKEVGLRPK